jgi:MFS family permease
MFIFSITGAIGNVELSTYLNLKVKDSMLGKVSGIGYAMSIGASALGPVIGGYSVQRYGIKGAVIRLLAIVGFMALCSIFLPRRAASASEAEGSPGDSRPTAAPPQDMAEPAAEELVEAAVGASKPSVERHQVEISPAPVAPPYSARAAATSRRRDLFRR